MKYEVKVQDRVVGTVEKSGRWWMAVSVYHPQVKHTSTITEAERYLVNCDGFKNNR